ncbi:MAG: hypothetical protein AB1486_07680 [Planctomycetota bacterium]
MLELVPDATIDGNVVDWNGKSVGRGVTVMAWPFHGPWPTATTIANYVDLESPVHILSTTDDAGTFCLRRLSIGQQYVLMAGGAGYLSRRRIIAEAGTREDVKITVSRLYGTALRVLNEASGEPIALRPMITKHGMAETSWTVQDRGALELADGRLAVLAGFDVPVVLATGTITGPFFYTKDGDEPRIGPLKLRISIPGYKPCRTELWMEMVRDHLVEQDLRIEPIEGSKLVDVTVRLSNPAISQDTTKEDEVIAEVRLKPLQPMDGDEGIYSASVRAVFNRDQYVGKVPRGQYEIDVKHLTNYRARNQSLPPVTLNDSESRIKIACDDMPTLQIVLVDRTGQEWAYDGGINATFSAEVSCLTLHTTHVSRSLQHTPAGSRTHG